MSQIFTLVLIIVMGLVGGLSSIYLIISLPAVIIWKIYRAIRYGYKLTD